MSLIMNKINYLILVVIAAAILAGGFVFISRQKTVPDNPGNNLIFNQESVKPTPKMIKQYQQFPGVLSEDQLKNKKAVLETSKGKVEFEIYPEATKAASNFIFLTTD